MASRSRIALLRYEGDAAHAVEQCALSHHPIPSPPALYRSAAAALGKHASASKPTVKFAGAGRITFGDGVMGQGDYQLTYSVKKG